MSTFTLNSITVKGLNVIAKLVAGSTLQFTRIAIGDGAMPSDKTPLTVTDLTNKLFDVTIQSVTSSNGQATVMGVFSNQDNETGFFYRELGLFAKDPETQAEFLYCYGNAGADAEWISPSGSSSVIEKEVKIVTLVGNAETVTASIPSGIYATKEEMNTALSLKADLDATAEDGGRVLASQMRLDADQTLYVDAAAADGGDGSEEKPFKTIQAAINARYKGAPVVYIKIKAGTYNENISTPRAPGTTWRFTREGTGTVAINTAVIDNCAYVLFDNLTFNGPTTENSTIIYVANTASVHFNAVTVNGTTNATGVNFSTSRGIICNSSFNNCGIAIAATDGAHLDLKNNGGTGNTKALHADGAVIICDWYVPAATTPYEKVNGGAINVEGGTTSFPSNYSQMYSLGDFNDASILKTAILAEFGKLGIGEKRDCWFACNIASGFGPFSTGQRMQCTIIKNTNSGSGYGVVMYRSHHNAAAAYMQIQDGAFATTVPVKFADANDVIIKANWQSISDGTTDVLALTRGIYSISGVQSAQNLPTIHDGTLIVDDQLGSKHLIYFPDIETKIYSRSQNGGSWQEWKEYTPGIATTETYGLVRVADDSDVLEDENDEAAITPAVYHDVSDFRHKETTYAVGDKVECMFNFELFLECTQGGTTGSGALDTRNVTHGQVITDGTVQWTVRTHIRSVNNAVADAAGNVSISKVSQATDLEATGNALGIKLWDYFHRYGSNYVPDDTSNDGWNALGLAIIYYDENKIANQPSEHGQLINIPADKGNEGRQIWIDQYSGQIRHRGGTVDTVMDNQPFTALLDTTNGGWMVSKGTNGWIRHNATGFTFQWGKAATSGTVTFPRSFLEIPVLNVQEIVTVGEIGEIQAMPRKSYVTTDSFSISMARIAGSGTDKAEADWYALGFS